MSNVTKPYRVRDEFVDVIKERRINMIVETREDVAEADLVNAVLWKHLKDLTTKDVLEYREKVLGKD
ncbi:hypothetical protein OEG79_10490 [Pseudomonas sp. Z8(2022)]|uniref:hypothetical protein n=1 Tax=Pseudomonas sp. Z8(2022) TaxID=2962597 RepID=UPI0021F44D46|nr:hypothetical protein [Pseudomonas sp. Z8(2022)]UYP28525.1 hypothetical protein OEG79_10540 [Pseudomonas sp. Z8(2022)]UYP28535.1 hypothetical protein OEG79_10590 [Pseudomonas sp. Z8(2022)]UYP32485.1 hypothetical protein OEG79_10490 [Pseudomonas sp. Z8(2022)]